MVKVFIGLGSNLDEPQVQLQSAIDQLKKTEFIDFIKTSHFYLSKPMGPQDQPDFVNAVVELNTSLTAEKLLDTLQEIENSQGRVRSQHWGPRTLDLDILLYGGEVIKTERLTVPHSGISERNFVLYPLNDLVNSDFEIPNIGNINELLANCTTNGLKRLEEV